MDVLEAIRTRRTIAKFRPEPVPAETLTEILATGVWAPNHRLTEPWPVSYTHLTLPTSDLV